MEQEKQVFEFDGKEYSEDNYLTVILYSGDIVSGFFSLEELECLRDDIIFIEAMTLNDYQKEAEKTGVYPPERAIIYPALGLNGEAGEVADKVKKVLRDNEGKFTDEKKQEIALELGDVLWYVAIMARDIGYSLEQIAGLNIYKLRNRQQRGKLGGSGDNR